LRYLILSQARLPIPPQGHFVGKTAIRDAGQRFVSGGIIAAQSRRSTATMLGFRLFFDDFGRPCVKAMIAGRPKGRVHPFSGAAMREDVLNTSLRKFLKTVGVTSQREIEQAIRAAVASGKIKGNEALKAKMVLTIGEVGLDHTIESHIELE
jgi:hypothetical protein